MNNVKNKWTDCEDVNLGNRRGRQVEKSELLRENCGKNPGRKKSPSLSRVSLNFLAANLNKPRLTQLAISPLNLCYDKAYYIQHQFHTLSHYVLQTCPYQSNRICVKLWDRWICSWKWHVFKEIFLRLFLVKACCIVRKLNCDECENNFNNV